MKLYERKELAWQYWLQQKFYALIVICEFTNLDGWCFWCPLVSIIYIRNDPKAPLVQWLPMWG